MHLYRCSPPSTAKVVILESGFCVLKALIEIGENGVFSSSVVKKRRYWPLMIPGDEIDKVMEILHHYVERWMGLSMMFFV